MVFCVQFNSQGHIGTGPHISGKRVWGLVVYEKDVWGLVVC